MTQRLSDAELAEIRASVAERLEGPLDAAARPDARPGRRLFVDPEDDGRFDRVVDALVSEFDAWIERTRGGAPLLRNGALVAGAMLHCKWRDWDGRLGWWTADDLDAFFLDYAPRNLPSDDELVADAAPCAVGFLRFLDEMDLLAGDSVRDLTAFCDSIGADFAEAAPDRSRWGPAKLLVAQMQAEGVDASDRDAVTDWMEAFNSRSREERDRVLGPALDREFEADVAGTGEDDEVLLPEIEGALAPATGEPTALGIGWFPIDEYERARKRWQELDEVWKGIPHDDYCARMEATFRGWSERGVRPHLVPLQVADYVAWCENRGEDPVEARAAYVADKMRLGSAAPWPPARNEPCWCGSERKYKKCCGAVTTSRLHPLHPGT